MIPNPINSKFISKQLIRRAPSARASFFLCVGGVIIDGTRLDRLLCESRWLKVGRERAQ